MDHNVLLRANFRSKFDYILNYYVENMFNKGKKTFFYYKVIMVICLLVFSFILIAKLETTHAQGVCEFSNVNQAPEYVLKCAYQQGNLFLINNYETYACDNPIGPVSSSNPIPPEERNRICNYIRLGLYTVDATDSFTLTNPADLISLSLGLFAGGLFVYVIFRVILISFQISSDSGQPDKVKEHWKKIGIQALVIIFSLNLGGLAFYIPNLLSNEIPDLFTACEDLENQGYGDEIVARCYELLN